MMVVKSGSIEKEVERALSAVFSPAVESKAGIRGNSKVTGLRVSSTEIGQFLNRATFYGQNIPHRFLKTEEARRQFAMALIDARAFPFEHKPSGRRKTPQREILFKTTNRELRDYLSRLLAEFGIENSARMGPILSKEEKWREFREGRVPAKGKIFAIAIPARAFKAFNERIGFRDKSKAGKLAKFIAQSA